MRPPPAAGGLFWRRLWKKGQSGNPKGRPKGCRNKSTKQAQILAQGMLKQITIIAVVVVMLLRQGCYAEARKAPRTRY
jgi:hypothetical protein